jgi:hypothetical protein
LGFLIKNKDIKVTKILTVALLPLLVLYWLGSFVVSRVGL